MSTWNKSALLVIDVQNDVVADAHNRDAVITVIGDLVTTARQDNTPVVWVQHSDEWLGVGSDGWQIVPELVPEVDETIIHKQRRDSFQDTDLEAELQALGVDRLVVAGAQTDLCIRWTLHGALSRAIDTVLVSNGHTTDAQSPDGLPTGAEIIAHTNSVWASQTPTTCAADVVPANEVVF